MTRVFSFDALHAVFKFEDGVIAGVGREVLGDETRSSAGKESP